MNANLNDLSKTQLIAVGRQLGIKMPGDYARTPKDAYIGLLTGRPGLGEAVAAMGRVEPAVTAVVTPSVEVIRVATLAELFGLTGRLGKAKVRVWNDPEADTLDKDYRFNPEQLFAAVTNLERGRNTWLAGPAGTGKTEFVRNLAAALGRKLYRVSFDGLLEPYQLIGGERPVNGSMTYQRGVVLQAMGRPGSILLLDEVGFARPEYQSSLHSILEPQGSYTIPETAQVIKAHPDFAVFACDNSNGTGDETGLYAGVRPQNAAFLSRFSRTLQFSYMAENQEAAILMARSGCSVELSLEVVRFMTICRGGVASATLEVAPNLREAIALCEAIVDGIDAREAFQMTMVNKTSARSGEALQLLWRANMAVNLSN